MRSRSRPRRATPAGAAWLIGLVAFAFGPVADCQEPEQPKAPAAPLPNRANELLPPWLRVRGEFRERMEGFEGSGFVDNRDDLYWLSRLRLNATVAPSRDVAFHVQVQDARVAKKQVGATGAPFRGPFDLRSAFADVGGAASPVAVRVGRQELVFGEQRLVGHVGWLNTARTFDAARVTIRSKRFQVDAFGASVVRILDEEFDKSGSGNRFFGVYGSTGMLVPQSTIEPYLLWRGDRSLRTESGAHGNLEVTTVGVRCVGTLPARFEYGTEMAAQIGSLGSDSIRAWAGHWQLRVSTPTRIPVRFTSEYNYASGDANPADGRRGTFDQLYPTGHDKYGLADQVGWRNIHHLRWGGDVSPWRGWQFAGNHHSWWLAETADALYSAGSALVARVAGGAAVSHVGQEIDVQASRAIAPQIQVAAGYAYVFPGGFLKQATPGASYSHSFVMVTYVFLAEK